jgi:hypothetical protein
MASSTTQQQQRQLYSITRSESTWLVETYKAALEKGEDNTIEPNRVFRDALETQKPAYLGKFNNSHDASVQGTFYAMSTHLYYLLHKLFAQASDLNHDVKITALCKLLPTSKSIAYDSVSFLNWAVYNWHFKNEIITEDLSDNCHETTTCAVCDFTGEEVFYFSTAYGLEKPVCENCVSIDDSDYEKKNDSDEYVVSEEEDDDSEEEVSASEAESDDPDYEEESDESASESDESEADESEADESEDDESEAEAADDESASESDTEAENTFGCTGCDYSWRDGWRLGWKAAMKEMRKFVIQQKKNQPDAPRCENCDISHGDLKKCGGQCGGSVRYCSSKCQTADWPTHKECCKMYY